MGRHTNDATTVVYADMVADLFHWGHVEFLRRARELGDVLVIGIHDEETSLSYKRRPIMTLDERVRVVSACRYVDHVLPGAPLNPSQAWLDQHDVDLVVHGDDADDTTLEAWYGAAVANGTLTKIAHSEGISTSTIVARVLDRADELG